MTTTAALLDSQTVTGESSRTVYLVSDALDTREALTELMHSSGVKVKPFDTAEEFLNGYSQNGASCLLVDEQLPGMRGSELIQRLQAAGIDLPAILVAANATTPFTVSMMRSGAAAVLDKPCSKSSLATTVEEALTDAERRQQTEGRVSAARQRLSSLTDGERKVLDMVLQGTPNKQIARRLGVCVRTVEARRSRVYQAANVGSVAELVRLCVAAGFVDA